MMDVQNTMNWTTEFAFTFDQSYYFSVGYFTCAQFHSSNPVARHHK